MESEIAQGPFPSTQQCHIKCTDAATRRLHCWPLSLSVLALRHAVFCLHVSFAVPADSDDASYLLHWHTAPVHIGRCHGTQCQRASFMAWRATLVGIVRCTGAVHWGTPLPSFVVLVRSAVAQRCCISLPLLLGGCAAPVHIVFWLVHSAGVHPKLHYHAVPACILRWAACSPSGHRSLRECASLVAAACNLRLWRRRFALAHVTLVTLEYVVFVSPACCIFCTGVHWFVLAATMGPGVTYMQSFVAPVTMHARVSYKLPFLFARAKL